MALEELYRQVILDHYRNPRHSQPLAEFDAQAEGVNPLCGDEVTVELVLEGEKIVNLAVVGRGCSISQSSASMMAEAVFGKNRTEVEELYQLFREMMEVEKSEPEGAPDSVEMSAQTNEKDKEREEKLGELAALSGVKRYPVRIKCALLSWTTLAEALQGIDSDQGYIRARTATGIQRS